MKYVSLYDIRNYELIKISYYLLKSTTPILQQGSTRNCKQMSFSADTLNRSRKTHCYLPSTICTRAENRFSQNRTAGGEGRLSSYRPGV